LQGYGQRDPLVEYKREAYRLFQEMTALIDKQVAHAVFKVQIAKRAAEEELQSTSTSREMLQFQGPAKTSATTADSSTISKNQGVNQYKDVGRNDPCPCGSGKKFKKCHGA
jgi:preprotein translocase subunit SecA